MNLLKKVDFKKNQNKLHLCLAKCYLFQTVLADIKVLLKLYEIYGQVFLKYSFLNQLYEKYKYSVSQVVELENVV